MTKGSLKNSSGLQTVLLGSVCDLLKQTCLYTNHIIFRGKFWYKKCTTDLSKDVILLDK